MKKLSVLACFLIPFFASANEDTQQCQINKYNQYIDTSIVWYQDLSALTSKQYPDLTEVSQWFLKERKNHFDLNREAVAYYLKNDPSKVDTDRDVESWLKLSQEDIKTLSSRTDVLGEKAKLTFDDRQSKPHEKNYELRSAFAELLSNPSHIQPALEKYNVSMQNVDALKCKK
ncbi:hypothetical protein N9R79_00705 [Vibrio sp.]|nr:hypothetical protein [Vibrio sp.]